MAIYPSCGTRTMRVFRTGLIALAAVATLASSASAEWGDLKIKFKLSKALPPRKIEPIKPLNGCKEAPGFDAAAVGPQLEVPNIMMWLQADDPAKVNVHLDLVKKTTAEKALLDNKDCLFVPHCLIATAGQTLRVTNSDAFGHNSKIEFGANTAENPQIPAGGAIEKVVKKAEKRPATVMCGSHPHMTAWIMVAPTPYHAVSGPDGTITIKNLPVGKWEFKVWHEVHGNIAKVVRSGKPENWTKGVTAISIAAGENDLGEIQIVPKE